MKTASFLFAFFGFVISSLAADLTHALVSLRPGAVWTLNGASYEGLVWADESQAKPTQAELEAEVARLNAIQTARKSWPDKAAFWAEFTDTEKAQILTTTDARIKVLYSELTMWSGEVWSDDAKIQAGLSLLQSTAILTPERQAAILAKHPQ